MSNATEPLSMGATIPVENAGSIDSTANVEIVARERYTLGGEIAQGGIGRILRAGDKRLERQVALKQLLDPTPENEARFLREALVTAKLQHPSIVPVYDVGRFPDGEIFYAMKLVNGRSLGDVVEEAKSFDQRLALLPHVIAVAEAIAYAHCEGIVHRDLKPANVIIGPFGETVVIDWGIAKDLREQRTTRPSIRPQEAAERVRDASTSLTMAGAVLGTPGYMPPEQAGGEAVDERADVYALGAILYHVLAGVAPYEGKSGFEVLTRVLMEPPPDLLTREWRVPRDLLAIVQKAMARERRDRYPTAKEFAHDLRRFQTGQIVGAYHYSRRERVYRFAQKHRAVMATTALGLLVVSLVAFTSLARVLDARRMAETERDRANEERTRAEMKKAEAETASRKALEQSDELLLLEARNAARRDPNAAIAWLSSLSSSFDRWGEVRLIAADAHEYGIAKVLRGHTGAISMVTYSPSGRLLATASDDRKVGLWTPDGKLIRMLEGHTDEVWRIRFSPRTERLLTSSKDKTVLLWDTTTGKALRTFHTKGPEIAWIDFMGDDDHVAVLNCNSKQVELHNALTGTVDTLPGESECPGAFSISSDLRQITYISHGHPRTFDFETRKIRDYPKGNGFCLMVYVTPDRQTIACNGTGGFVSIWDAKTGRQTEYAPTTQTPGFGVSQLSETGYEFVWAVGNTLYSRDLHTGVRRTWNVHEGPLFSALFSRDGRYVATTSFDRTATFLDLTTGNTIRRYGFHDTTSWADFSPDNHAVAVASWDSTARIFPLATSRNRIAHKGSSPMKMTRFSADGQSIVSVEQNGSVHIDSLTSTSTQGTTNTFEGECHILSPDATLVAYATKKGVVRMHKVDSDTQADEFEGHKGAVERIIISPDNRFVASSGQDETIRLWERASHQGRIVSTEGKWTKSYTFSGDGAFMALGDKRGRVIVVPTAGGPERIFEGHVGNVNVVKFTPDHRWLISGGQDHTLRVWDVKKGHVRTMDASGLGISQILVSHDGKIVYSLGTESAIRRWNLETGEALPILRGHRTMVMRIDLSPEGSRLVSTGSNGDIRVWDLATGQSRLLEGHAQRVPWILFSPQGDRFISAGDDGTTRIWYDNLPFDGPSLRAWMANASPDSNGTPTVN